MIADREDFEDSRISADNGDKTSAAIDRALTDSALTDSAALDSVLSNPGSTDFALTDSNSTGTDVSPDAATSSGRLASTSNYTDNTFERLFIWLFSRKMAAAVGQGTDLSGYDGFVDLSQKIVQGRSPNEQRQVVAQVLNSLVPGLALKGIRTLFSPTQLVCELNAWFATQMFEWLVGPCAVTEVEVTLPNGTVRMQKSGVQIQKCRYLEQSRCVGTCVNLCKLPTQDFFTQEFGIPLTMTPDFEDMSCTMVFGQQAPAPADDPAFSEPCLVGQCDIASAKAAACPKAGDLAASGPPSTAEVRP